MSRMIKNTTEYLERGGSVTTTEYEDGSIVTKKNLHGPATKNWSDIVNWFSDIVDENPNGKISYFSADHYDPEANIGTMITMTTKEEKEKEVEDG